MKTNTYYLVKALGLRSANVNKLAEITELTIPEILTLETAPKRLIAHRAGRKAVELGIILEAAKPWQEIAARGWRFDLWAYWRGVLDAMKEKELH